MNKELLERINNEKYFRTLEVDRDGINEKERTAPLAFSSEEEYKRWFGIEILDHSKECVDLARLNNSAPLLSDHDSRVQIGVVVPGTAVVGNDKKGRLIARFGRSKKAKQEFQDVLDGIRTKVSVGYRVHEMVLDGKKDDVEIYRVTKWEPYEVSLVSIPADDTVGIGKSDNQNFNNQSKNIGITMDPEEKKRLEEIERQKEAEKAKREAEKVDFDIKKAIEDARQSENERIRAINAATAAFKSKGFELGSIAEKHISEGSSCEVFIEEITKEVRKNQAAIRKPAELGLTTEESKKYSLYKAMEATVSGNWKHAGFERECSKAISDITEKKARGIYIPADIQIRAPQSTATPAAGGNLVATDLNAASFIDLLRDNSVLHALGITELYGLVGFQDIPKKLTGAQTYWLDEDEDTTDSAMTFGMLTMSPKTLSSSIAITRRMRLQATPDIENMSWNDMAVNIALAIDYAGFEGDGLNNTPLGISNTGGVNTQSIAASATTGYPTWAEAVGFETALATDNNLHNVMSYVTTAIIKGGMKITEKFAGGGKAIYEGGLCNEYPVVMKNDLVAKRIIFGYFRDLIMGHWGILDAVPDAAELAKSNGLVVRFFQDLDMLVRVPESFCINN